VQSRVIRAIGLATLSLAAAFAWSQGKISGVSAKTSAGQTQVTISGQELPTPTVSRVNGDTCFILQFNAELTSKGRRFSVRQNGLSYVHLTWFSAKPPTVRVLLKVAKGTRIEHNPTPEGWLVTVTNATAAVTQAAPAKLASAQVADPEFRQPFEPAPQPQAAMQPIPNSLDQVFARSGDLSAPNDGPQGKAKAKTVAKPAVAQPKTPATGPTGSPDQKQPLDPQPGPDQVHARQSGMVSMDFINTDVVQILKALAVQAGVNIVAAPELSAKDKPIQITVSLDRVTVTEALDLVTTVAGLQYARVGKAFVVTTREKFGDAMKSLGGDTRAVLLTTRVVPIYSGEAATIRASVLASLTSEIGKSSFEILLPSDEFRLTTEQAQETTPGAEPGTATGVEVTAAKTTPSGGDQKSKPGAKANVFRGMREQYLILVGPHAHIDIVEGRIRELDRLVMRANGKDVPSDPRLVRETYTLQSPDVSATDLVTAITAMGQSTHLNCDLFASPPGFPTQTVVLVGRDTEVRKAMELLAEIDNSGLGREIMVYEVKYADPRSLSEAVTAQVPGIRVSIPPGSAGNPRLYTPAKAKKSGDEQGTTSGGGTGTTGAGAASGAGGPATASVGGDTGEVQGLNQPFSSMEAGAMPMRLVLKGTKDQIERALAYILAIDTAPKQVALELRVAQVSKEDALRLGIDWNLFTGGAVKLLRLNNSQATPNNTVGVNINNANIAGDVTATLDATLDKNNIIARPNLLALDGRETELFVGDVVRYIKSIQSTQSGITVTTGEVRIGVRLAVLPRIGGDGSITMDVRPVVSFLRGFTPVPGGGQLPQTSERVAQSTLNLKSGETIAIGGLIQSQDVVSESGVPILKDIPIIGNLFKRLTSTKNRTEIVFFLTARTVDGPATASSTTGAMPMHEKSGGNAKGGDK
jgi:type II secretory pathway component GspD/PulD (secretin)